MKSTSPTIWKLQGGLAITLWIFFCIIAVMFNILWPLFGLIGLHFLELIFIGISIGKKKGYSTGHILLHCLLFGYIWWVPVQMEIYQPRNAN